MWNQQPLPIAYRNLFLSPTVVCIWNQLLPIAYCSVKSTTSSYCIPQPLPIAYCSLHMKSTSSSRILQCEINNLFLSRTAVWNQQTFPIPYCSVKTTTFSFRVLQYEINNRFMSHNGPWTAYCSVNSTSYSSYRILWCETNNLFLSHTVVWN